MIWLQKAIALSDQLDTAAFGISELKVGCVEMSYYSAMIFFRSEYCEHSVSQLTEVSVALICDD